MGSHQRVCSVLIQAEQFYTSCILVWDLSKGHVVSLYQLSFFIPVVYLYGISTKSMLYQTMQLFSSNNWVISICRKDVLAHRSPSHHLYHWCDGLASVGRMSWLISQLDTIYTIGVMAQHL